MRRKEVLFAVIGGIVGAVLVMAVGLLSPLGAQNEVKDAEFGTITCRQIWVVNSDDSLRASIGIIGDDELGDEEGGMVAVYGKDAKSGATMGINKDGGFVSALGTHIGSSAKMSVNDHGGSVSLRGKDAELGVAMSVNENGGSVIVHGKDASKAVMRITDNGGVVFVDRHGRVFESAVMAVDENGGIVMVTGTHGANSLRPD